MCDRSVEPPSSLARGVRRRSVITAIAAAPFAVPTTTSTLGNRAAETRLAPMPRIIPRLTWGPDLAAKGIIEPEEVRFLIIHHTEEPGSDYEEEDVPRLLAGMYNFHTGGDKGWPDLAYNFLVDKFGNIYEGRTGSTDGPVQGSATGGNQGFTQLCCFIGDYSAEPPPQVAIDSMLHLLAWLADRYDVETRPGSSVEFTSRGSNRWAEGTSVVTPTICGHRDMSMTECPGDATYPLVKDDFQGLVSALRPSLPEASTPMSTATSTTTAPAFQPLAPANDQGRPLWNFTAAGGAVVATVAMALVAFRRRPPREPVRPAELPELQVDPPLRQVLLGDRRLFWDVSDAWPRSDIDRLSQSLERFGWLCGADERPPRDLLAEEVVPRMRTLGRPQPGTTASAVIVLSDRGGPAVLLIGEVDAWWGEGENTAVTPNRITILPSSARQLTVRFASPGRPTVIRPDCDRFAGRADRHAR